MSARTQKDTFKLGWITGFTGVYQDIAKNQYKGAQLAVAEINKAGGIDGRKVVIVEGNDNMDPELGRTVAKKMVEEDNVDALAGSISAATQLTINEVARAAGIPFVSCSQSNSLPTAEHRGPYTFHEGLTPYMSGLSLVRWGIEALGKRWAFLMPDYQWGYESYQSSTETLAKMGGTDAGMLAVTFGATVEEYEQSFDKLLAMKPDVISVRSLGDDQANFARAAARTGLKKEVPILIGISEITLVDKVPLDDLVGMYWGCNFYWGIADKLPSARRYVDAFQGMFDGELPTGYSGYAYAGVKEMLLALAETGGSYEKMQEFMEGRHYDHYKGAQWWRPCDHQSFQDFYILRFKGPEESTQRYDVGDPIGTVSWDLTVERTCVDLGFPRA